MSPRNAAALVAGSGFAALVARSGLAALVADSRAPTSHSHNN